MECQIYNYSMKKRRPALRRAHTDGEAYGVRQQLLHTSAGASGHSFDSTARHDEHDEETSRGHAGRFNPPARTHTHELKCGSFESGGATSSTATLLNRVGAGCSPQQYNNNRKNGDDASTARPAAPAAFAYLHQAGSRIRLRASDGGGLPPQEHDSADDGGNGTAANNENSNCSSPAEHNTKMNLLGGPPVSSAKKRANNLYDQSTRCTRAGGPASTALHHGRRSPMSPVGENSPNTLHTRFAAGAASAAEAKQRSTTRGQIIARNKNSCGEMSGKKQTNLNPYFSALFHSEDKKKRTNTTKGRKSESSFCSGEDAAALERAQLVVPQLQQVAHTAPGPAPPPAPCRLEFAVYPGTSPSATGCIPPPCDIASQPAIVDVGQKSSNPGRPNSSSSRVPLPAEQAPQHAARAERSSFSPISRPPRELATWEAEFLHGTSATPSASSTGPMPKEEQQKKMKSKKVTSTRNHLRVRGPSELFGEGLHPARPAQQQQPVLADRFIPSRRNTDLTTGMLTMDEFGDENTNPRNYHDSTTAQDENAKTYTNLLKSELLGFQPRPTDRSKHTGGSSGNGDSASSRPPVGSSDFPCAYQHQLFKFKSAPQLRFDDAFSTSGPVPFHTDSSNLTSKQTVLRKISKVPYKVLDAPQLQDDFYLNLVDWSSTNCLSVGLSNCVYLWSACTSRVTKLCDLSQNEDAVTSVSWTQRGSHLAVGTNKGEVQIWDVGQGRKVRTMTGHRGRVGTMAWNGCVLSTGSRDHSILHRDVRQQVHYMSRLSGHRQEVCGLKWSFDEQQLASGGNDNKLYVWNMRSTTPVLRFSEHQAAVKALAWSPHQYGLLCSGGGTADRCIRFWNTALNNSGNTQSAAGAHQLPLQTIDTGSQVCNLCFSTSVNELVSTHGYSLNQIIVWKYPSMSKVCTLTGHTYRVLYLALSPDGQSVVTGAGDETLRFWNVFPGSQLGKSSQLMSLPFGNTIR